MNVYDCFRILELPRNAGLDDLKFAYRSKAKLYHPDRKGGDSRKFNRLHEAYTFLLDYGPFKKGYSDEELKRHAREKARRTEREAAKKAEEKLRRAEREAARKAEEERLRNREMRERAQKAAREKAERDKQKREAELAAARKREERRKEAERQRKNNPSHKAHLAGKVLSENKSDREKIKAIDTLVSLKRKSVYPYLKNGFYNQSEKVVIASIKAVGKLRIVQAGPELSSLMCSGSVAIKMAVLETLDDFPKSPALGRIVEIGLSDRSTIITKKAQDLRERLYG